MASLSGMLPSSAVTSKDAVPFIKRRRRFPRHIDKEPQQNAPKLLIEIENGLSHLREAHAQPDASTDKHKGQDAETSLRNEKSPKHNDPRLKPHVALKKAKTAKTASVLEPKERMGERPTLDIS